MICVIIKLADIIQHCIKTERKMFKIIYKHLAYNFIVPFGSSLLFFVSFLLIFQIFRILEVIMQKEVNLLLVAQLIGHIGVSFLPNAIPLSTLFAIIYVLGKLSEDSEMIALRSFGYSKYRIFAPFMVIGILISLSVYSLTQTIIPYSQKAFKIGVLKLTSKSMLSNIKKNEFFVDIPHTVFYAEDKEGKNYKNVFINRNKNGVETEITAQHGFFVKQKYDKWGAGRLRMTLFDGNILEFSKQGDSFKKIFFEKYEFPIMDQGYSKTSTNKLSTLATHELVKKMKEIKQVNKNSYTKNRGLVRLKIEYWDRLNNALLPLLFIFLGFSLGIKQGRGRGRNSSMLAFGVIILYYTLYFTGVSSAKKFIVPAEFAVFFPASFLFSVGVYNFRKLNWLS